MQIASPIINLAGAVAGQGVLSQVAMHYGAPIREQRALVDGQAICDLSWMQIIEVSGPDRLTWLHSLTSQSLLDMTTGESRELLSLSPQGHIEAAAGIYAAEDSCFLLCENPNGQNFFQYLQRMQFAIRVTIKIRSDIIVLGSLYRAEKTIVGTPLFTWQDPWPGICSGGTTYYRDEVKSGQAQRADYQFYYHVFPQTDLAQMIDISLNAKDNIIWAGYWAWEALQIAAWRPRISTEVDDKTIAPEIDWLRTAVHLHKGCYRGQETIARVVNLGKPPRRLVFLDIDGASGLWPSRGAKLWFEGRLAGQLTSVAQHYEDGLIGLAVVKRSLPTHAVLEVEVESHERLLAQQTVIVNPDGKALASPAQRPGAGIRVLPGAPRGMQSTSL